MRSASLLPLLFLLLLPGCHASPPHRQSATRPAPRHDEMVELSKWWQPWLAYLRRDPYPALHVHVDYLEDCRPNDAELCEIHDFLASHVDKPGGISIQLGAPISIASAKQTTPQRLALLLTLDKCDSAASDPGAAYLHLLFYDGRHIGKSPAWKEWPHSNPAAYPAMIYLNVFEFRGLCRRATPQIIEHEIGHTFGLVSGRALHNSGHCDQPRCLMKPEITMRLSRMLSFSSSITDQTSLCDECEREIAESRASAAVCNTRFLGPIELRLEQNYFIASLPGVTALCIGQPDARFANRFAQIIRQTLDRDPGAAGQLELFVHEESVSEVQLTTALDHAARDPQPRIRKLAIGAK